MDKRNLLIHMLCWGMVLIMPLFFARPSEDWMMRIDHYLRFSGSTLAYIMVFYANYLYLVPKKYFARHKKHAFFWMNVALIVAATAFCIGWSVLFFHLNICGTEHHRPFGKGFAPMVWQTAIMLVLIIALALAIYMAKRWKQMDDQRREAQKARSEAELSNLRNQLNPHFLLNTLNNIYALIAFNPDKAQTAVMQLSKLLRHMLYDNQNNFVPLYKEIAFLNNYTELMKIRVTQNVNITTQIDVADNDDTPIAPLIFISLIENAFKHGISPAGEARIAIRISSDNGVITCEIRNSNHPKHNNDKSGSGIGLAQVHKRLELMYPQHYTWEHGTTPDNKEYFSTITIYSNDSQMRNS